VGRDLHKSQYILLFYRALYCSAFLQLLFFHLLIANFGEGDWDATARVSGAPSVGRERYRSSMVGCEWGARWKEKINEDEDGDEGM
jgi:hypothetical protein